MIKIREIFSFLPLIDNSVTMGLRFDINKYNQYFAFFIWVAIINVFINIIHIIQDSVKALESLQLTILRLIINN